jgi:hypothetical protein
MFSLSLFSQNASIDLKRDVLMNYESTNGVIYTRMLENIDNIDESQAFLINKIWQKIDVVDNLGKSITIDSANYNIERDLILFFNSGNLFYLYPDQIKEVKMGNRHFISNSTKSENKNVFFEKLSEGELSLLKRYSVVSVKSNTHPMGIQHNNEPLKKKIKEKFYFFDIKKDKLQPLPKKKKKFLSIFKKNRNKLLDFIRRNNLSNKNEDDLVNIFNHYNRNLNID